MTHACQFNGSCVTVPACVLSEFLPRAPSRKGQTWERPTTEVARRSFFSRIQFFSGAKTMSQCAIAGTGYAECLIWNGCISFQLKYVVIPHPISEFFLETI